MSTTTASVRSTARTPSLVELRLREAAAREAARRRVQAASRAVAQLEEEFQQQLARFDAASRRLPDLSLQAPSLPTPRSRAAENPAALERYQAEVARVVGSFKHQLDASIAEAERLLERRLATAAAWRLAGDLEQRAAARLQAARAAAERLDTSARAPAMPARPNTEVGLEAVQRYVEQLQAALAAVEAEAQRLEALSDARERAAELGGPRVAGHDAAEARARHVAERRAAAQAALRTTIVAGLAAANLGEEDLSASVRTLIEEAMTQAEAADRREQVARWIARDGHRHHSVQRALCMMQEAPELVHEEHGLAARWVSLLARLQRVASGLEELTVSIEREYEQLRADASRQVTTAFTKADWIKTMTEQGFEVLEHEDGGGLVLVDLDHPEVWLEATELQSDQGGFGAVLELRTDADLPAEHDAAVTSSICKRLAQAQSAAGSDILTETAVIERAPRIERGRRPPRARKSMALSL
jgi:hypothetical protein